MSTEQYGFVRIYSLFCLFFVLTVSFLIVTQTFLARAWFLPTSRFLINAIKIRTLSAISFTNHTSFSTFKWCYFDLPCLEKLASKPTSSWWCSKIPQTCCNGGWRLFRKKNFQNKAWEIHMAINQISEKEKLFDILFWKNSFILLLTVIRLSEEHRSSDGILVRQIFKKSNELDRKLLIKVFKGLAVHENCLRHWVGLLIQTQNIDFSVAIAT